MENILKKKGESSSLSISEIVDSKRGGYFQATYSDGTTIILFFHESGINWAGKSLP